MREAVYVRDLHKNILYMNPASEQLTGWSQEEARGRKCYELFGEEHARCRELCPGEEAAAGGAHSLHHECSLKTRSGDIHEMRASISPIRGAEGVAGTVVVMEKITRVNEGEKTGAETVVALENEIERRKRAGKASRKAHAELELRVEERTVELKEANERLSNEIADREKAEQALRENEQMLSGILATSPIGIGLSRDRQMQWCNDAWIKLFGFEREHEHEYLRQSARKVYPSQEEYERVGHILYHGLETGMITETDATFRRRDGSVFHGHIRMKALDPRQLSKGTIAVILDITESKQAEEALRASEGRYKSLYCMMRLMCDNVPDLIWAKDLEGKFLFANRAICDKLLNATDSEEPLGKTDLFFAEREKRSHPSDPNWHDFGQICFNSDQVVMSTKKAQRFNEFGNVKGEFLYLDVYKAPFWNERGEMIGTVGCGRIVTEEKRLEEEFKRAEEALRESEERFRTIFESVRDGIFVKNQNLNYTHVNPALCNLFGLPESQIVGRRAGDFFDSETARQISQRDNRVLDGESIEWEQTITISGVPVTLHESVVPLRNTKGDTIGICGIAHNVTERRNWVREVQRVPEDYPSEAMRTTFEEARLAANSDSIVLLQGESGSGKDFLARWIHDHSRRANGPYFSINCAAVSKDLAESELFGHERGAFTGAVRQKRGLLELAEGGTILLNEIGELELSLQSKLLTFLDTKKLLRVGGQHPVQVSARLIAASHRDLRNEVAKGRFLEPLFYRLSVFPIRIPSLRERVEDLPLLAEELMSELALEMQLDEIPVLDSNHRESLARYGWPGNVRELRNVIERSLMLWRGGRCNLALPGPKVDDKDWCCTVRLAPGLTLRDATNEVACALSSEVLRRTGGNKKEAANILGISRDALYRLVKKFGIQSGEAT